MTVALFEVRPTFQSGTGLYACRAESRESRFAVEPHRRSERLLRSRWYLNREGELVCAWQFDFPRTNLPKEKQ